MIVEILAATVGLTGATVAVAAPWARGRDRLLRARLRAEVIVTLRTGVAFRGVLFEADDRTVVLRNAVALGHAEDGVHLPVDGEVLVARTDVEFFQRP